MPEGWTMSHDYRVGCSRCKQECGQEVNRGQALLLEAVRTCFPVYLLSKTKWSVSNLDFDYYGGIASFLVEHFECDSFYVQGEYSNDEPVPASVEVPSNYHAGAWI